MLARLWQQRPPMHCPVAHSPPPLQACPLAFLQVPAPSQALAPLQVLAGNVSDLPGGIGEQVPCWPATPQDMQLAVQLELQQYPSTQ